MTEIRADLVIGADGRRSTVRERARLDVLDVGSGFGLEPVYIHNATGGLSGGGRATG